MACRTSDLDFVVLDREDDGSMEIRPREGFGGPQTTIILSPTDGPGKAKLRLHIDVNATDRDQDAELERLLRSVRARRTSARPGRSRGTTWPNPEGNEFCLEARLDPL